MPWLWAPNCLLFPHGFQPFCDWLKLGELSRVTWGTFRFRLFFIRFAVLNYVPGQIFKSVGVFLHFIYLLFGENSNFCGSRRFVIGCKIG
jgi:hypothetical protein